MIRSGHHHASSIAIREFIHPQYSRGNSMSPFERTAGRATRILVPIDATEDSRWGVRYSLWRRRQGADVEVILLNVGEPITQWQVLRFRTQREIAEFQSDRAQSFIEDAGHSLAQENIPYRGLFRQGDTVFSILDTAEELDCDEIAMPLARWGSNTLSKEVMSRAKKERRDIPVVIVNSEGVPVTS